MRWACVSDCVNWVGTQMLRIHNAEMCGWTTMQRTQSTRKMNDMINNHIDRIPAELHLTHEAKSLQIACPGEIFNVHFLKECTHRSEEQCHVEQFEYTCWDVAGVLVWEKQSRNADSFDSCSYHEQSRPDGDNGATGSDYVSRILHGPVTTQKCQTEKRIDHDLVCSNNNCVGRVMVTNFVVSVMAQTTKLFFVIDRAMARNSERNVFSMPRPVNICYTGTVNGHIEQTAICSEMNQGKKRGPCGSEIHIDTSMGVMQIFGNNGGSRKITCKAFLNVGDANYIVDRVCAMVRESRLCILSCI